MIGQLPLIHFLYACTFLIGAMPLAQKQADADNPDTAPGANRGIVKGMTGNKLRNHLGEPTRIARQILLGRHVEQWTYAEPVGLRIEFNGVRGQEIQVVSVHSLRSKKP